MDDGEKVKGSALPEDFRAALLNSNAEDVVLPSGLKVKLLRLPIFSSLSMSRQNGQLVAAMAAATSPEESSKATIAYLDYVIETLKRLFVFPRFSGSPLPEEIGPEDVQDRDVKFIFRWMGGEVTSAADGQPEDLEAFPSGH